MAREVELALDSIFSHDGNFAQRAFLSYTLYFRETKALAT